MSAVVYAASVEPLREDGLYARAFRAASEPRRKKAERYRFDADRRLCLGSELVLRAALRSFGFDGPLEYEYGEHGKPRLKDCPIRFSLSHSGRFVLCAAAEYELGCDLELLAPAPLAVAERFFCPGEYAALAALPDAEAQSVLFFRYWTLKESFLKATGLGLQLPLNSFEIFLSPRLRVEQTLSPQRFSFAEYSQLPGFRCAVCAADGSAEAAFTQIELTELPELR